MVIETPLGKHQGARLSLDALLGGVESVLDEAVFRDHSSSPIKGKLCPPLPQTSIYFLRTYSMLTLVCCCIHLCARFKNVEMLSLVLDGISG